MVRRDAFLAVGGFEPRPSLGCEERLLSIDLLAAGWRLVHDPGVVVRRHPVPVRPSADHGAADLRDEVLVSWLRMPLDDALGASAALARRACRDRVARRAVRALARHWWFVVRRRRPVPGWLARTCGPRPRWTAASACRPASEGPLLAAGGGAGARVRGAGGGARAGAGRGCGAAGRGCGRGRGARGAGGGGMAGSGTGFGRRCRCSVADQHGTRVACADRAGPCAVRARQVPGDAPRATKRDRIRPRSDRPATLHGRSHEALARSAHAAARSAHATRSRRRPARTAHHAQRPTIPPNHDDSHPRTAHHTHARASRQIDHDGSHTRGTSVLTRTGPGFACADRAGPCAVRAGQVPADAPRATQRDRIRPRSDRPATLHGRTHEGLARSAHAATRSAHATPITTAARTPGTPGHARPSPPTRPHQQPHQHTGHADIVPPDRPPTPTRPTTATQRAPRRHPRHMTRPPYLHADPPGHAGRARARTDPMAQAPSRRTETTSARESSTRPSLTARGVRSSSPMSAWMRSMVTPSSAAACATVTRSSLATPTTVARTLTLPADPAASGFDPPRYPRRRPWRRRDGRRASPCPWPGSRRGSPSGPRRGDGPAAACATRSGTAAPRRRSRGHARWRRGANAEHERRRSRPAGEGGRGDEQQAQAHEALGGPAGGPARRRGPAARHRSSNRREVESSRAGAARGRAFATPGCTARPGGDLRGDAVQPASRAVEACVVAEAVEQCDRVGGADGRRAQWRRRPVRLRAVSCRRRCGRCRSRPCGYPAAARRCSGRAGCASGA